MTAPRTLPGEPFGAVPPKPEPAPPLGLPEWAEETRRMLVEVYPADIFVRSPESKEPGCRILHAVEEALDRYYDIKADARR